MKIFTRSKFARILILLVVIVGAFFISSQSLFHVDAAPSQVGPEPTWSLPFPTGTQASIGSLGLHDHNFFAVTDDSTHKHFTFNNYGQGYNYSLDFIPVNVASPITPLASGTVLAVQKRCHIVIIDHGNGWWAVYLHIAQIKVTSGASVTVNTTIGFPNTKEPLACGETSTGPHVHVALINATSATTGNYVTLQNRILCSHQVVELNNDLTDIILQGLTQSKGQVFTVPSCTSVGHFQFSPTSVSVTAASGQNPPQQMLTMTNTGNGTLVWNLTSTLPSWLTINSTSGSLALGGSATLTLTFNLPATPGSYSASLVFSAPNADNSPASVPVTATVTPIGHFQISPSAVNVTATSDQNPSPQTLTMMNGGNGPLAWNLSSTLPSWLAVSPLSDSLAPGASETITLTFSLSNTPSTYSTTLVFSASNTDNSPTTVAVTATIVGWGVVSSPNDGSGSNRLFGLAVVSASDIWVVGNGSNGPLIEHYDGTSWSIIPGPSNGALTQVAAVSASDVWAVGFSGNPSQTFIEHYDGTNWSVVPSPSPGTRVNELTGIAVTSANDIWTVGYDIGSDGSEQTLIEHYDGTSWSVVTSPDPGTGINQLVGVTVVSTSDVWSVGDYTASYGGVLQPLIEHYNGTSWSVVSSPTVDSGTNSYELLSVAAISSADIWAVGSNFNSSSVSPTPTLIEHWDGTAWTIVPSPTTGAGGYLQAVAADSTSDVWAVGFSSNGSTDQTLVEHWDGSIWSIVTSPDVGTGNNALYGVAAITPGDVWAIGYSSNTSSMNQTLIENYN